MSEIEKSWQLQKIVYFQKFHQPVASQGASIQGSIDLTI